MAQQLLTDQQLQELVSDKSFTPEDATLLTPNEKTRLAAIRHQSSTVGRAEGVLSGVAKGAGETAINLGKIVHKTPILGSLTDALAKLVGPEGTDPNQAFQQDAGKMQLRVGGHDVTTEAGNTAESIGKGLEQVGEFMIPAGPSRLATIRQLVKMIPNATKPSTMKMLVKAAQMAGRVGGEAASAGGVSMVHGEQDPQVEAAIAGGSPLAGEALSKMIAILKTPFGQKVAPVLAAAGVMPILGGLTPSGIAGTMGTYGLVRGAAAQAIAPGSKLVPRLQRAAKAGATFGGRASAGTADQLRLQRRRLQEGQ